MDLKTCPRCATARPLSDFSRKGDGLQPVCRPCNRRYQREHYQANKARYKRRARAYAESRRAEVRAWVWEYLERAGCRDCGVSDPRVLDFDHRDPSVKEFQISQALSGSYTLSRVRSEVDKCDVRCANCHRLRTAEQLGWYAWRDPMARSSIG